MARIRSVHPELCIDETLAEVTAAGERTFVRLWPHLDDDGRAIDNPKLLKAALYPLHDDVTSADVDRDLDELANVGLVIRYQIDGHRYLSAKPTAWAVWQKPRHRYESKFPPPPGHVGRTSDAGPTPSVPASTETNGTTRTRSPSDVSPTTAALEGSCSKELEEAAAAAVSRHGDQQRQRQRQRDQVYDAAIDILVERHLATFPSKSNPQRHANAVRRGKHADHQERAHELLDAKPEATAQQLADWLEPTRTTSDPVDQTQRAQRALMDRNDRLRCPTHGQVHDDNGQVIPCPECR